MKTDKLVIWLFSCLVVWLFNGNRGQKSDDRKQKAEDRAGMAKRLRRRQGQKSKIRNIRSLLLKIIIL